LKESMWLLFDIMKSLHGIAYIYVEIYGASTVAPLMSAILFSR